MGEDSATHKRPSNSRCFSRFGHQDCTTCCSTIQNGWRTANRPRPARPTTVTARVNVEKVRERIRRNSSSSVRRMAKEVIISEKSVRMIDHDKLQMKNYKLYKAVGSTEKNEEMRLKRYKDLMRHADREFTPLDLF
ncbi:hypothetical protein GCK32_012162 [Trichostrongylus colubriformis]|uniref:Uncharacterized protein n=1 Tax=Trichostrongylus colubriformis TaxID=6319 RepID=A0AAN8IRQ0_TRICO